MKPLIEKLDLRDGIYFVTTSRGDYIAVPDSLDPAQVTYAGHRTEDSTCPELVVESIKLELSETVSEMAVRYGLCTLATVIGHTGQSRQTLTNWHTNKPNLLRAVFLGCREMYGEKL